MRLEDIARASGLSVTTIHRIEKCPRRRMTAATLSRVAATLGLSAPVEACTAMAWARALRDKGVHALICWRFVDAVQILDAEDLVAARQDPAAMLEGEILREWARVASGAEGRPDVFEYLAIQARRHGAARSCVWACILAGATHARTLNVERAMASLNQSVRIADDEGAFDERVIARAALSRYLFQSGQSDLASAILADDSLQLSQASPYGQARWRHSKAMVDGITGHYARAEQTLRAAAALAVQIPNYQLAALVEGTAAALHQAHGGIEKAEQAVLRAARFFMHAGRTADAMVLWSDLVSRDSPDSRTSSRHENVTTGRLAAEPIAL